MSAQIQNLVRIYFLVVGYKMFKNVSATQEMSKEFTWQLC